VLVLGHLLISAEQVAGGIFTPADPTADNPEKQAASLTLIVPGGELTVTDDAAVFLFNYLVENHGTKIDKAQAGESITVSKEAVRALSCYFELLSPTEQIHETCKAIVDQLAKRI
jgi:hypothetical protein